MKKKKTNTVRKFWKKKKCFLQPAAIKSEKKENEIKSTARRRRLFGGNKALRDLIYSLIFHSHQQLSPPIKYSSK
jgi:hypothetical protein